MSHWKPEPSLGEDVPDTDFSDDDIEKRLNLFYGEDYKLPAGQMPLLRLKLAILSEFIRDIKVNVEITKAGRLRYRSRYFTDSGIIGSKDFVSTHYQRLKHLFAT